MPFAKTEALRRELAGALPERSFTVRFWDDSGCPRRPRWAMATAGTATFMALDATFFRSLVVPDVLDS